MKALQIFQIICKLHVSLRGEQSRRDPGGNLAGILGGRWDSRRESCRDSWREGGFPVAKISAGSRRESCRDSWRVTGYLGGSVAGICDGKQNSLRSKSSRQPKSPRDLSGILPGFAMRTIININQTTRR